MKLMNDHVKVSLIAGLPSMCAQYYGAFFKLYELLTRYVVMWYHIIINEALK